MNHTQTAWLLEILDYIFPLLDDRKMLELALKQLAKEIERLQKMRAGAIPSDRAWGMTDSMLRYMHEITRLHDLVKNEMDDLETVRRYVKEKRDQLSKEVIPIKVAFFTQEMACWASFKTVYAHLKKQKNVLCQIVPTYTLANYDEDNWEEFYEDLLNSYREHGYDIMNMESYDLTTECPDIVFFAKPYLGYRGNPEKYYVNEISKHVPYTVFISYCLDAQGGAKIVRLLYGLPAFYRYWRIIGYSEHYKMMMQKHGYRDADNVVLLGHPKFDNAYDLSKVAAQNRKWRDKVRGRVTVLWNTHFTIHPGEGVGTFFRFKDTVLSYFAAHQDMVLLWRPHPLFWSELEKTKDSSTTYEALDRLPNVIVDRTPDYYHAFAASDALISDASTFLVEYNASGNPVLYTSKPDGERISDESYLAGIQEAASTDDVVTFLENLRNGKMQDGREERMAQFSSTFGIIDGKIGERIGDYVLKEVVAENRRFAEKIFPEDVEDIGDIEDIKEGVTFD